MPGRLFARQRPRASFGVDPREHRDGGEHGVVCADRPEGSVRARRSRRGPRLWVRAGRAGPGRAARSAAAASTGWSRAMPRAFWPCAGASTNGSIRRGRARGAHRAGARHPLRQGRRPAARRPSPATPAVATTTTPIAIACAGCARRLRALDPALRTYACVDSGAAMEKAWAERAGLGFIGKNGVVINREHGSWLTLSLMVLDRAVDAYDAPHPRLCGECREVPRRLPDRRLPLAGGGRRAPLPLVPHASRTTARSRRRCGSALATACSVATSARRSARSIRRDLPAGDPRQAARASLGLGRRRARGADRRSSSSSSPPARPCGASATTACAETPAWRWARPPARRTAYCCGS